MALLHTPDNGQLNPAYSLLHFQNFKAINGLASIAENKWMYLISNQIQFDSKIPYAIRLNKPDVDTLFVWLERIVTSNQCSLLFVEQLCLDDLRVQKLKLLCEAFGVTMINLTLDYSTPENVVIGPWGKMAS